MARWRGTAVLYVVALLGPLAVAAILATVRSTVPNTNAALVLVLVIVAVAALGRRSGGILTAVSSAVWFDFFLTQPYHHFSIAGRDDIETAVLLTVVGVSVAEIALWGRRQQARSSRREGYLDGVVSAARMAAAADTPPEAVVAFIAHQIVDVLGIDRCDFRRDVTGSPPRLNRDGTLTRNGRVVDVDRLGLPTDDEFEMVVDHDGGVLGHFVMACATRVARPSREQRLVAVTLAEQASIALAAGPADDLRTR